MSNTIQFLRNKAGATSIEYALIASLIAVVIISGVTLVAASLNGIFGDVASKL